MKGKGEVKMEGIGAPRKNPGYGPVFRQRQVYGLNMMMMMMMMMMNIGCQ